ncbi:MAG: hypothetical protein HYR85_14040 [Planctomycetes bacterium]|nr:hypothetical protein [Planctomycetota bacterium]
MRIFWAASLLLLVLGVGLAFASGVATGNYIVEDQNGTNIGSATVSSDGGGGKNLAYADNPDTDHPPNTGGSYSDPQNDGTFNDNNGPYTVSFIPFGSGCYIWIKRDQNGNQVDAGTMCPPRIFPEY